VQPPGFPASIASLAGCSAIVSVGPPLLSGDAIKAWPSMRSEESDVNTQPFVLPMRLFPAEVIGVTLTARQSGVELDNPLALPATIVFRSVAL
jgi:hypothetical protein